MHCALVSTCCCLASAALCGQCRSAACTNPLCICPHTVHSTHTVHVYQHTGCVLQERRLRALRVLTHCTSTAGGAAKSDLPLPPTRWSGEE